jgi:transglutaminase-like putative cysteine protease
MPEQSVTGVITPEGKLDVKMVVPGGETTRTLDWPEGALMSYGMHLRTKEEGLEKGTRWTATLFSPETLSPMQMTMEIGETKQIDVFETERTVIETRQTLQAPLGKMTLTTCVDPETAEPVLATIPMIGMTLKIFRCDKAFALSPAEEVGDLFGKLAIPADVDPASATTVYTIETTSRKGGLVFPTTDLQSVKKTDGQFVVTVTSPTWPKGGALPYSGDDKAARAYLKASDYVQSDAAAVKKLAATAIGDATTGAAAAKNIERFVSDYIEQKDLSVGYASALEVVKGRRGDCTEHALLTAALSRAAGIPAQVVTGVVWVEEFGGQRNVMLPHAWNQVYIDGQWVPIDAAMLHRRQVGSGRIALAVGDGDMDAYFGMLNTLGNFRIVKVQAAD